MAITKLNSQAIPPNTIVESDLSYPLTNFSSTGIDDNADALMVEIHSFGTTPTSHEIRMKDQMTVVDGVYVSGDGNTTLQLKADQIGLNGSGPHTWNMQSQNSGKLEVGSPTGAGSNLLVIDTAGNVGINESSPDELLHVKGPDEVVIKIEATGSQAPTLYDGKPKLKLVPMATNGITGEAIIEAGAPSSLLDASSLIFRAGKSQNQFNGSYVGGSFSFHDGNTQVCSISAQGIEAANFSATSGGTTALSLSSAGRVTTGENLEVAGTITSGQIFASDTVTTGSPQNGAADFLSLTNNDTGGDHHIGIKFASADAGSTLRHGAYVTGLKDGTWGDGTGSYPMHLTFWTRPASSGVQIERMRIQSNGNVGIGTSSPAQTLDVVGNIQSTGSGSRIIAGTAGQGQVALTLNDGGGNANLTFNHAGNAPDISGNNAARIAVNTDSSTAGSMLFEVGTAVTGAMATNFAMYATGDFHADGDVIAYSTSVSDERLKDDIQPITGALDAVGALRGVTFTWNDGSRQGKRDYGLIAQEVEKVIPEVVHETVLPLMKGEDDKTLYKTIDYDKLVSVLVEAISELRAEVEALKNGASE